MFGRKKLPTTTPNPINQQIIDIMGPPAEIAPARMSAKTDKPVIVKQPVVAIDANNKSTTKQSTHLIRQWFHHRRQS